MPMRWILVKDVQILRRSKLLVGLLIVYPIAIATLMGFALSSSPEKPRVAYLNQVPPNRATIKPRQGADQHPHVHRGAARCDPEGAGRESRPGGREGQVRRRGRRAHHPARLRRQALAGRLREREIEVIYNGDALKLSLVDSTITAKLAAADAELSGQISRLANGYIDVLLDGGAIDVLGTTFPILGLKNSTARIDAVLADNATAANKRRLGPVSKFAHLALANSGRATAVLSTVTEPVDVERTILSGRRTPLDAFAVAVAVAMSLMFVCVLLASGLLALEREENTFSRLARGLASGTQILIAKIVLAAACSIVVTLAMLLGVSIFVPLDLGRIGLWLVALSGSAIAFATLGRRDRLARARGAGGVAAGVRARAADRVPRARAERRRRAAALRRHPRDLRGLPVQGVARGDRRRGQRLVAGHRPGARAPGRARRPVRRGGALRAAALRLSVRGWRSMPWSCR